jgi:hypothetical protein
MAFVVKFDVNNMDATKYDEVIRRLDEMGQGAPEGRMYHFSYGDKNSLQVIDIYDSLENLEAFGSKLVPILEELGVEARPTPTEIYNVIPGA